MKFIHLSDLHLGKVIYSKNLLDIQIDLLNQVVKYMNEQNIELLVIAGDVYDRSIPSLEAVNALNSFLDCLINQYHKKVLMISGNHDSSERLNFASDLLSQQGLHIVAFPSKELLPIVIDDVNFYLVPFFKPSYIKYLYQNDTINSYHGAYQYYLSQQNIDFNQTNVLVTHQFIAGNHHAITSDSEVLLSVGGSEIIDVDLFEKFDYVALGHLHASQKIKYDYVRYAGSLMKYSFDEVNQVKGMVEVSIEGKEVTTKTIPLKPTIDLIKVKGLFEDIKNNQPNLNDYIAIELLDTKLVPNAIDYLHNIYPNILQLTYPNLNNIINTSTTKANNGFESLTPLELFGEFYEKIKNEKMNDEEKQIIENILKGGDNHDA